MMVFNCGTIIADIVCRKRIGSGEQAGEVAAIDINLSHWFGDDDAEHAAGFLSAVNPDREDESNPPCSCSEGKPCYLAQFVDVGGSATFEDGLWEVNPAEFAGFLVSKVSGEDDWWWRWE